MTTFYLIRHGENDLVGHTIAGRSPAVHLNAHGKQQARRLAEHLAGHKIQHLVSSPLERARETAEPLAQRLGLTIEFSDGLLEVNFGEWTRKRLTELDALDGWRQWNSFRSGHRAPGGESMLEVQARFVGEMQRLRQKWPEHTVALFSHGDALRAGICYWLGLPLDLLLRLELSTASYTVVHIGDFGARFQCINVTPP